MISFAGHQSNRHRLFKRTNADLGKHVLEVHPGHSQGHVKQVLHDMHSEDRDSISIMIKHHGQPVNIAFYALRDDQNKYLGCVEVTQDVSKQQTKGSFYETLCKSYIKINICTKKEEMMAYFSIVSSFYYRIAFAGHYDPAQLFFLL